ncbi:MAG TPA: DUF3943 domain-containing protein [Burkholderiales bacterium]|nr:DUF3943 domain-containing protein [Burkholderiales bacterium]
MRADVSGVFARKRKRRVAAGRRTGFACVVCLSLLATNHARADDVQADKPSTASPDSASETDSQKSYWIPAAEILGFQFLLNQFDRNFIGDEYKSNWSTIKHNLGTSWRTDSDSFTINQLGHPYQGSMYYGFARSAGLNYWESLGYTTVGSAVWEIAGEATPPSLNDQITTSIGGSFLGEALYRMSNLVLDESHMPAFWRELGAAVISPPTGLNRLAFGSRFDDIFSSHDPVYYARMSLGASAVTDNRTGTSTKLDKTEGIAEVSLDYGLPGKPGYTYDRPFDYFTFKATVSTANGFENLMTRGLLIGTNYEAGNSYRGIWGLFGSYDYIDPQTFRVASTAVSIGTTAQWWLGKAIALQGSALAGAGYASVGTVNSSAENDNHYGVAPQALIAARLIFGNRASVDITSREYFVGHLGGAGSDARDNIIRTDAAITARIHRQHALAVRYTLSQRDSDSARLGDMIQRTATIGLFYTYLGNDGFGAVDWRDGNTRW